MNADRVEMVTLLLHFGNAKRSFDLALKVTNLLFHFIYLLLELTMVATH